MYRNITFLSCFSSVQVILCLLTSDILELFDISLLLKPLSRAARDGGNKNRRACNGQVCAICTYVCIHTHTHYTHMYIYLALSLCLYICRKITGCLGCFRSEFIFEQVRSPSSLSQVRRHPLDEVHDPLTAKWIVVDPRLLVIFLS